ncbi:hypothetical protein DL239_02960 [Sedimentitalea sp. CY04]|uniref:Glucosyl transferase GtrII n=1 Tax=Parasedimentitalea denitrificans TaxID=2211118 RepID=A0ABX0W2Q7_9RHOB|nr:hypothetical protein [Sedimentitalea sp. CY04]NIZ59933.1 hypothetical protein [Sedimentitalea sp. CY04]
MTLQATFDRQVAAATQRTAQLSAFWKVFAVTLIAITVMSAGNLLDPIVRYDDYPALFAEPEGFWSKTLSEGRWLNYFWHLRGIVTPAWVNFAIYQAIWALFAAAIAVVSIPGNGRFWFACVLALTILVAPSALLIAPWFNTLTPGTVLLAVYAVLATRLSQRALRSMLPVFTLLSLMAYTTFPIVLLLICLVRTKQRSLVDLAGLVGLFGASFIVSLLAIYALNWQVHGVFSVVPDQFRSSSPAVDFSGVMDNFQLLIETLVNFGDTVSFHSSAVMWFHIGMFTTATVILARCAPLETLYLHAGLWIGIALVVVQVLKLGVTVPVRAYHFAWIAYAIVIVRACEELSRSPGIPGRLARNAVLLIAASYLLQVTIQFTKFRDWQVETRALAQDLATTPGPLYAIGYIINHPSAEKAGLQKPSALPGRIRQLTGRDVTMCVTTPEACSGLPQDLFNAPASSNPQIRIVQSEDDVVIVFPPLE